MKIVRKYGDNELLEAIINAKERNNAVRFIYSEYFDTISSLITYNKGSMQDAEDIFQEVVVNFIDIVQKGKFRGESSIKTFLVSLARYTWLNQLKKNNRSANRDVVFEKGREHEEADVSEYLSDMESKKELMTTIEKLGETCRKILILFYYEGLSMREMLSHFSYENEQVVRNKKHKCLQQLTQLIKSNPLIRKLN